MTGTTEVLIWAAEDWAAESASWIARAIADCLERQPTCTVALAGGSTPRAAYERLADPSLAGGIDWSRVGIWFGDERCVPPDDPASNYRMAREALLDHVPLAPAAVHRMRGELAAHDAAALEYEGTLPMHLDLLLLGVGTDGHTASLFPGSDALRETRRRVVAVTAATTPAARLTITPPVIAAATRVAVLAAGAAKSRALACALARDADVMHVPAALARRGSWLLDRDAAAGLTTT